VESSNARARDELFAREIFDTVREARALYADWCHSYNTNHPHSALGWMAPAAFAAAHALKTLPAAG
jgi:putative transposase